MDVVGKDEVVSLVNKCGIVQEVGITFILYINCASLPMKRIDLYSLYIYTSKKILASQECGFFIVTAGHTSSGRSTTFISDDFHL